MRIGDVDVTLCAKRLGSDTSGKAVHDSSDIRSHTLSQLYGLEHIGPWTETQDDETGVGFILELSSHGNPSFSVRVLAGLNVGKTPPRFHRLGDAWLQSQ